MTIAIHYFLCAQNADIKQVMKVRNNYGEINRKQSIMDR